MTIRSVMQSLSGLFKRAGICLGSVAKITTRALPEETPAESD